MFSNAAMRLARMALREQLLTSRVATNGDKRAVEKLLKSLEQDD